MEVGEERDSGLELAICLESHPVRQTFNWLP